MTPDTIGPRIIALPCPANPKETSLTPKPAGNCSAKIGLAGWADIVTFTFFTQGSAATTSLACFSNCKIEL
ncbi:hypothetical protein Leryth_022198 [Lithospermum erythrorhizon]|nr:hypothetical protein Leryth_022198 [Lithospermum erythrorhizon]